MPSPRLHGKMPSEDGPGPNRSDALSPSEDWTRISDKAERRRVQNRISQRKYRQKMKMRMQTSETGLTPPTPDEISSRTRRSPGNINDEDTHSLGHEGDDQTMPSPTYDYINEHDLPPPSDESLYTPWIQPGANECPPIANTMSWPPASGGTGLIFFEPSPVDWGPPATTAASMTPVMDDTYMQPSATSSPWWVKTGSYVSCTELPSREELDYQPQDDEMPPPVDTRYVRGQSTFSPERGGKPPGAA